MGGSWEAMGHYLMYSRAIYLKPAMTGNSEHRTYRGFHTENCQKLLAVLVVCIANIENCNVSFACTLSPV